MLLSGQTFFLMMISAANALDNHKEHINNMNIFPVPDGDTGINMSLTMSTVKTLISFDGTISDCAEKASHMTLRAARGNSGAILSLFFRGMSKALRGLDVADTSDMAAAFRRGTDEAYKAVMNPTEGTILSIMKACTERAEAISERCRGDLVKFFSSLVSAAEEALAKTPDQLPVLREVNLVDAGGYGFVIILSGMLSALQNNPVVAITLSQSEMRERVFSGFETEDIRFTYCTECMIDKNEEYRAEGTSGELKEYIGTLGDSVVFLDDEEVIKLHVHTDNPGLVLEKAIKFGALASVKIENMKNQHTEMLMSVPVTSAAPRVKPTASEKKYGFVSVCAGEGISAVFKDLGADSIIVGGQTMNPSTQDILNGINNTPSETVFICPNNKNIYMVAEQAAQLVSEKNVFVLPTKSVPQGVSAMLAFDLDADTEANLAAMNEAINDVTSISVTHAVRDTVMDGKKIENGQFLGLVNGAIDNSSKDIETCLQKLSECAKNKSFVNIFYGEGVSESDAERCAELFGAVAGRFAEINLINGGQPIYPYIISVE